jgi:hypothetical protein
MGYGDQEGLTSEWKQRSYSAAGGDVTSRQKEVAGSQIDSTLGGARPTSTAHADRRRDMALRSLPNLLREEQGGKARPGEKLGRHEEKRMKILPDPG